MCYATAGPAAVAVARPGDAALSRDTAACDEDHATAATAAAAAAAHPRAGPPFDALGGAPAGACCGGGELLGALDALLAGHAPDAATLLELRQALVAGGAARAALSSLRLFADGASAGGAAAGGRSAAPRRPALHPAATALAAEEKVSPPGTPSRGASSDGGCARPAGAAAAAGGAPASPPQPRAGGGAPRRPAPRRSATFSAPRGASAPGRAACAPSPLSPSLRAPARGAASDEDGSGGGSGEGSDGGSDSGAPSGAAWRAQGPPARAAAAGGDDSDLWTAPTQPRVAAALEAAGSWQWDAFELDAATRGRPLSTLAAHLIRSSGLVPALGLDPAALARWLLAVEGGYGDNPFHNRVHAADALHTMHVLLTRGGLLELLQHDPLTHLAALLAAPYAFARALPPPAARRLRRLMVKAVLATDLKQHYAVSSAFQNLLSDLARRGPGPLARSHELLLQVALKAADVGHATAGWRVHRRWVRRLEEEMFRQGDLERAIGLPVSPLMDRAAPGAAASQAGFLTLVVLPLLHSWTALLPAAGPLLYAAMSNRAQWEGEAVAARARAKAEAAEAAAGGAAGGAAAGAGAGAAGSAAPMVRASSLH
ncbi:hypothetical protein Rsub_04976 [Raphidocelis subcapitata]|uniref:PDEase domain-containing protein n=1 Tax=Raphidocelis subcapitata TaxID=307507 RepID=A0A2V0NW62_9CHLO|nr:hypothetical protein Rsub_04976 [Raphidocelis subcapitata]|eukprot:GBF91871.1 hypothetical protein Rsub_04976 [Raphidocelis subcapitata]